MKTFSGRGGIRLRLYESSKLHEYRRSAQAKPSTPPTSASGDQSTIAFSPRFPGFRDSGECAVARESVRFCAPTGLVIPAYIEWLAGHIVDDPDASVRELVLAHWVLGAIIHSADY